MQTIAELKNLIRSKYGTEAELARKLGWSRQKINRITNEHRKPNIVVATQLSEALGIPVTDIIQIFLPIR